MVKMCKFDSSKRCYHSSCDVFDCNSGNVSCCGCHLNPFGFMMPRKVGVILVSVFNKHVLRRG